MLFDLLCNNLDNYIKNENLIFKSNNNDYNIILKDLETIYDNFEKKLTKKNFYISKL
jgi:hypothetical protein